MVGKNISYLAKDRGYDVIAPNRSQLDLSDKSAVRKYLKANKPDVVIHCAGLVGGIQANIKLPYEFCFQNLDIGMNVLTASFEQDIERFINLGSSCMYPRNAENPLKEFQILTGELEPTNEGYAIAKLTIAKLVQYISAQFGLKYRTLIPCNLYGTWDKFDVEKSHMIPAVIRKIYSAISQDINEVSIWGNGQARREFMYAGDLADFVLFALDKLADVPDMINVGLGYDYSVNEYYQFIADVLGYDGNFSHDLTKPSGMNQKLVDISLQTKLGWAPKVSIQKGIEATYNHFLNEVN